MSRRHPAALFAAAMLLTPAASNAVERSQIPAKYHWDLTALYPSEAAWQTAKADLEKRIPGMSRFKGKLGESPASLLAGLQFMEDLDRDLSRLYTYASQSADEDARIAKHLAMRESASQLNVTFGAASAFVRPEILKIGATKVHDFLAKEPKLTPYRMLLDDILRRAPHTLTDAEEAIVAKSGRMSDAGETIREVFKNAEMPYPTIKLSDGKSVRLDDAAYTEYRALANRADRESVFAAFWGSHHEFQGTLGAALNAQTQAHVFYKDVRKYSSCLEAATFGDNIPTRVYTQLIADVHRNFPTLHRYLKLRQRMMGLKSLKYSDLYAPTVAGVARKYTQDQAVDMVLAAVKPLGQAYVDTLRKGLTEERWVDWMPNTGKASGAYSTGAYGVHPFQLQNFTGLYEEVGTLAHESGHSMHTYLADKHQPYVTHNYATFVAEVASTLNENLLFHSMLDKTEDKAMRLYLLGTYLDNLRGTLFRQTMFAEFELKIHEMAEKGETLTGEGLSKMYLDLVRQYYGHDKGICTVGPEIAYEWAYIDHFFYDFYVYQYATSIVASTSLANGIRQDMHLDPPSTKKRDAYLHMLQSGASKYPIDLLKDAGVDMTTSAPFNAAMAEMNAVMDEIEKLLK